MRRKDREIKEHEKVLEILNKCKVCRLAMQDVEGLYLVPLNFAYTYEGDQLVLYFHSARSGRKIEAIQNNPKVCFEMDCAHELIRAEQPCGYGYEYECIIGNGTAKILEDIEEKMDALSKLMLHQAQEEVVFTGKMAESVAVIKISVDSVSAKACHR